jgi:WD40 repeat protein
MTFSPDGTTLASTDMGSTIHLWQVATGRKVGELKGHQDMVWALTFSPDGDLLFSGSKDQTIHIWEWATGKERGRLEAKPYGAVRLAVSPDGKTLASIGLAEGKVDPKSLMACHTENAVRLWDVAALKEVRRIMGPNEGAASGGFPTGSMPFALHRTGGPSSLLGPARRSEVVTW